MNVEVVPDDVAREIEHTLAEWAEKDRENLSMSDVLELTCEDGAVEIRAFPLGSEPEQPDDVRIAVAIDENVSWYEDLGIYGPDNLRNGGPIYEALDEALNDAVQAGLEVPEIDFVQDKGSSVFSTEVSRT